MSEFGETGEYSLSAEQFKTQPAEIVAYKDEEPVGRKNFAGWLAQSFAISRGSYDRQLACNAWQRTNTGFDYVTTLENFLGAGGWRCLTKAEQDYFSAQFDRVAKHSQGSDLSFKSDPSWSLTSQIRMMLDEGEESIEEFIEKNKLLGLKKNDLLKAMQELDKT